jgi:hypothetical protein
MSDEDGSKSTGVDGIPIFEPLITSEDYYWFGHSIVQENWIFKDNESRKVIDFRPFCKIGCFEVVWQSGMVKDNQAGVTRRRH